MPEDSYVGQYLGALGALLQEVDTDKVTTAIRRLRDAGDQGHMIYSCGNGGSAMIAAEMTGDMIKQASLARDARFRMINLSDNVPAVMAYANDVSYEAVFVEQLRNFATAGDVLIGISGSGNSENVLQAVRYANEVGCYTIALTTGAGGRLKDMVDLPLVVPSTHMGHLEDVFFVLTHVMCYAFIEKAF